MHVYASSQPKMSDASLPGSVTTVSIDWQPCWIVHLTSLGEVPLLTHAELPTQDLLRPVVH